MGVRFLANLCRGTNKLSDFYVPFREQHELRDYVEMYHAVVNGSNLCNDLKSTCLHEFNVSQLLLDYDVVGFISQNWLVAALLNVAVRGISNDICVTRRTSPTTGSKMALSQNIA